MYIKIKQKLELILNYDCLTPTYLLTSPYTNLIKV